MTGPHNARDGVAARQLSKWLVAPVLYGILILGLSGCAASKGPVVLDHSSTEQVFAGFRRALADGDHDALLGACYPPLRPTWKRLLHWAEKRREAGGRSQPAADMLADMARLFCGEDKLLFERPQPGQVYVRNVPQGGIIAFRRWEAKWYVSFYEDLDEAEPAMNLIIEIIKLELGQRPADHGSVSEEIRVWKPGG